MRTNRLALYVIAFALLVLALRGTNLAAVAPATILLACPLMMIFLMMRGIHGNDRHEDAPSDTPTRRR